MKKIDIVIDRAFTTSDPAEAFRHFRPLAEKEALGGDASLRHDPALGLYNIDLGLSALRPRLAELHAKCPVLDIASLLELPALALALIHATDRVPSSTASVGEFDAALRRLHPLRGSTLGYLEIAAELELVPAGRVRAIREGSGPLDAARDALAIVALFDEYSEALKARHPFTRSQFTALAETGRWLLSNLTPGGARSVAAARSPEAMLRDRIASMLGRRHDDLRTAGVVIFGIDLVDHFVPPLWSAVRRVSEVTTEPAPAPQPAPVG